MPKRRHLNVFARPFATHYFTSVGDKDPTAVSKGAASTEQGAIRASIVRIFMGQYAKAVIIDRESGVPLYNVRPGPQGLQIRYGDGVAYKDWRKKA
jgi:hypothetical protein